MNRNKNKEPNEETKQAIADVGEKKNLKHYNSLQEFAESLKGEVEDDEIRSKEFFDESVSYWTYLPDNFKFWGEDD